MALGTRVLGTTGVRDHRRATHKTIFVSPDWLWLPQNKLIDGSESRDPGNGTINVLRPGTLMGKRTSNGLYAPSVIGTLNAAYDASAAGTTMTLDTAAEAVELARRIGSSGTFKLTGPDTASGTVRTVTVTYSAVNTTTGAVTVTDISEDTSPSASVAETTAGVAAVSGVSDVQTMTLQAGADGGTFKIKYRNQVTAAQNFNVSTADLQTAVRALHADLAATVVSSVGGVGVDYVFTTADISAVDIEIVEDMITDGGVLEPATIVHTTQGVTPVTAVTEVQTITMSAKAGTFRVGFAGGWTADLAYNVSTADMQTAIRTLPGLSSATVAGTAGTSYVVTMTGYSGDAALLELDLGGLSSYPGDFVAGSLVQPTDGSETPITFIPDGYGIRVVDYEGDSIDVEFEKLPVGGIVDFDQLLVSPSGATIDASIKTWVRESLSTHSGGKFVFEGQY